MDRSKTNKQMKMFEAQIIAYKISSVEYIQ